MGHAPDDGASRPRHDPGMADRISHVPVPMGATEGDVRISRALSRLESACASRPGFGHACNASVTTLTGALRCRTDELGGTIETDLPAALGGDGAGPTPSMLLRAALGSCLAMGYRLRAARHGVVFRSIRVVVETDSAIAGMLDRDAVEPAGFIQTRYLVEISSDAPREQVAAIVDEADRLSPVLDVVRGVNRPIRTLTITDGVG